MKRLNFDFSTVTIEKDVPVPGASKTTKQSGCTALLLKMKKGDSFTLPKNASTSDTSRYLSAMACGVVKTRKPNRKYTVRTEAKGVRVWRIK